MTAQFHAELDPSKKVLDVIARLCSQSPFCHPAYVAALSAYGSQPYAFSQVSGNEVVAGCIGFVSGPAPFRRLNIPTTPHIPHPQDYWDGLLSFCRANGVCTLELDTFAAEDPTYPSYTLPSTATKRVEYIMDLTQNPLRDQLSKNHQRNVRKAEKADLHFLRSRNPQDCDDHVKMMRASLNRRSSRGESVIRHQDTLLFREFLKAGIGEIFKVEQSGRVLASILILKSQTAAYYQSAGTHPDGMKIGASQFLVLRVAETLRAESFRSFNLGGAGSDTEGLRRYKASFGTKEVQTSAIHYDIVSGYRRWLRRNAGRLTARLQRLTLKAKDR